MNEKQHDYWEKNIGAFSRFYDTQSEEQLLGPRWLTGLYRRWLFPVEKHFMKKRFVMVSDYIDRYVGSQSRLADIGCGSGIFVSKALERGAKVLAIDSAQAALRLVEDRLSMEERGRVRFLLLDACRQPIPECDVAIAIGVLPYNEDISAFFEHILPYTHRLLFNFIDAAHPLNRVRRAVACLNVRHLSCHRREVILAETTSRGFLIEEIQPLATGYMVSARRSQTPHVQTGGSL